MPRGSQAYQYSSGQLVVAPQFAVYIRALKQQNTQHQEAVIYVMSV